MNRSQAHQKDNGDTGRPLIPSKSGGGPDPRLAELVRLLARRAAREWYDQQSGVRRRPRS